MTDGNGTTQYVYVPVGSLGAMKLQQEASPLLNSAITYANDQLGRRTTRTVTGAGAETVQYDALGRPISHASDLGSFTLSYLGQTSQIAQRQLLPVSANLTTSWSYLNNTGDRRLAGISNVGLANSQFSNYQYTTTPANLISAITEASDASPVYPSPATQTASYNSLNQLTNLSGEPLSYDLDGNLTSDGQRNYTWDAENRLIGVTYPAQPGKQTAFAYDGLGRRTAITSTPAGGGSAVTTSYIWCGDRLCQARSGGNSPTRSYYAEGELVPGTPAQSLYYGSDQIGSVRRVFASTTSAPAYGYDPYGNALQGTAPLTDFNYAGMFYNADSGLYLTQYRAYDPVGGRWLSRDPIGERNDPAANLYAYVDGNPISRIDPYGQWGVGVVGGGSAEGGIVAGVGATASGGGGLFGGGPQGLNIGGYGTGGAFAGGPGYGLQYPTYPEGNNANFAAGAFAGLGAGLFLTNACSASGLRGPFDTYTANIGTGPIQVSVQIGVSGGTWIGSVTFGPGIGVSVSSYPTNTWATGP
jgi:RHS repeat-associated protein